jgi:hypothetical protein
MKGMWGLILFNPFILLLVSFILFDGSKEAHKLFEFFDLNSFDG